MYILNARFYGEDGKFHDGAINIENGLITGLLEDKESSVAASEDIVDAKGMYVIPGLIDLHFHGALGCDVCDADIEEFRKIAAFELSEGVTSICPATMTLPEETLCKVLECGKRFKEESEEDFDLAELVGFNMEGPFISHVKKGAQNPEYIRKADVSMAERFIKASGGLVKIIGLAPEESPDFEDYIRAMKDKVIISLAHTNSDYDTAVRAIRAGASHAVHLYNAMRPFSYREPGVVNAIFDSETVNAELICDGIHLHPTAIRSAIKELSKDRIVIISDSLRAAGMPDGEYELGGQTVKKEGRRCTLVEAATIAGSVSSLFDCMTNVVRTADIPLEDAIHYSSANPARILGISDRVGGISVGKQADLVVMDSGLNRRMVFKRGRRFN